MTDLQNAPSGEKIYTFVSTPKESVFCSSQYSSIKTHAVRRSEARYQVCRVPNIGKKFCVTAAQVYLLNTYFGAAVASSGGNCPSFCSTVFSHSGVFCLPLLVAPGISCTIAHASFHVDCTKRTKFGLPLAWMLSISGLGLYICYRERLYSRMPLLDQILGPGFDYSKIKSD